MHDEKTWRLYNETQWSNDLHILNEHAPEGTAPTHRTMLPCATCTTAANCATCKHKQGVTNGNRR